MARKFDEPWMPFAELAVGTASPFLGASLAASRIAVNNSRSRAAKDDASGLYYLILALGGLVIWSVLNPPDNQPPQ